MKLDDVLATAGDRQLSDFDWGVTAVVLYNSLVNSENFIDVSLTGKQAYEKLRRLPSSTLMMVLTREVQIEGSTVEFIGSANDSAAGIPPTVPQGQRRMSPIAVMLMIIMTVMAVAMVFSSYRNPSSAGSNNEALKTVVGAMIELVKEENKSNEQSPQQPTQPEPAPSDSPPP